VGADRGERREGILRRSRDQERRFDAAEKPFAFRVARRDRGASSAGTQYHRFDTVLSGGAVEDDGDVELPPQAAKVPAVITDAA
jgi:hypothetical protein